MTMLEAQEEAEAWADVERERKERDAEIASLRAALRPFAAFAREYGAVASALDYPEDHVLLAAPPAGNPTVVRLSDLYAAVEALGEAS